MKPGIYPNIPEDIYHNGPGISKHGLDEIAKSPLHYWSRYLNPERSTKKDTTPTLELGTAIHRAVLEPDVFDQEYILEPSKDRFPGVLDLQDDYKQACKKHGLPVSGTKPELKARLRASNAPGCIFWDEIYSELVDGKKTLPSQDMRVCGIIAARFRKHPIAKQLLENGQAETSVYWTDAETGVLCRGRLDWLTPGIVLDLKTTLNASIEGFQRQIAKYRYHIQAAMYVDGMEQLTGDSHEFVFAAWEKHSPYANSLFYASPELIEIGRQEYKKLLRIYANCLESDIWPGYSQEILSISLPSWYNPEQPVEEEDWLEEMTK